MRPKTFIFSLGGSLIVPGERIDVLFLRVFKNFIVPLLNRGCKIVIVVGGGGINKKYNIASQKIASPLSSRASGGMTKEKGGMTGEGNKIKDEDLDWLGIAATKLNAELLRVIFSQYAHKTVLDNPHTNIKTNKKLIIASGWKPGCSSDLDAVLWAKRFEAHEVINLTDIDYVYDKDPDVYKNVKPIKNISWSEFISIVGKKWSPRGNWPFDPIASQLAQKLKIKVVIVNGKNLDNLKNYMQGKKFKGTVIE
ncbi:UMP kinase [Patescibacteria group bacterium AH-259-L05]|nr:UMP kinase [Patescibacteria group bacterium AH-259-L05]